MSRKDIFFHLSNVVLVCVSALGAISLYFNLSRNATVDFIHYIEHVQNGKKRPFVYFGNVLLIYYRLHLRQFLSFSMFHEYLYYLPIIFQLSPLPIQNGKK